MDVIEAGFPIASKGDFQAVRAVASEIRGCAVAGLARARREDIEAALGAPEPAVRPRVHVFLATSDLHLKHKLRVSAGRGDRVDVGTMVACARSRCPEIEFSAEDASRSDRDFLVQAFSVAVRMRARTILNVPDTVGYTTPGGVWRAVSDVAGTAEQAPRDCLERALPQRSGARGRQFTGGGRVAGARAGVEMRHQRDRRARRQRGARGDRRSVGRAQGPLSGRD